MHQAPVVDAKPGPSSLDVVKLPDARERGLRRAARPPDPRRGPVTSAVTWLSSFAMSVAS
ncbi:MAG TPA: hypothetical protein VF062_27035 [Candidatus Limnocylindrales bacterium]